MNDNKILERLKPFYLKAFDETPEASVSIGDMVVDREDVGTLYSLYLVEGDTATIGYEDVRKQVPLNRVKPAPPVMQLFSDLMSYGFSDIHQNQIGNVSAKRIEVK